MPRRSTARPSQQLGAPNYYELYRASASSSTRLAEQCRELLDETEQLWEDARRPPLPLAARDRALGGARAGTSPGSSARPSWDQLFPSDRMVPALEATLTDLGVDLRSQENVHLDLETAPVEDAARVLRADRGARARSMLVIQPIGGNDDWAALFHEAGHTEHFAHTTRDLTMEARRLGDNAVTEGWAMLLQHLDHRAGVAQPPARLPAARRARLRRRGLAPLLRPPLLREAPVRARVPPGRRPAAMRGRYDEILGDALKLPPIPRLPRRHRRQLLRDRLPARWAFEAQLRELPARASSATTGSPRRDAGDAAARAVVARAGPTADELLRDVTGAKLEMAAVADRVREGLGA